MIELWQEGHLIAATCMPPHSIAVHPSTKQTGQAELLHQHYSSLVFLKADTFILNWQVVWLQRWDIAYSVQMNPVVCIGKWWSPNTGSPNSILTTLMELNTTPANSEMTKWKLICIVTPHLSVTPMWYPWGLKPREYHTVTPLTACGSGQCTRKQTCWQQ